MKRALLWLLCACWLPVSALQVVDDRGVTVTLSRPPQRIVSLLPSLTETVCTLERCDRLVGVDRYSNWPGAVRRLPQVGGGLDPSLEAILALRPDLVLAGTSTRAVARLEALGVPVLALEPKTHADVLVRPGPRMAEAARLMAGCLLQHAPDGHRAEARR